MDYDQARSDMIAQQFRPWQVLDAGTLAVLSLVHREEFVPPALKALAFADTALPIGKGQVMLAPRVEARILQALQLKRSDRVLEIGAGTGFLAALLAAQADSVLALEIDPGLARLARDNLARNAVSSVEVRVQDGLTFDSGEGFDVMVATGAVHEMPSRWPVLLKPGGRLLAFFGGERLAHACLYRNGEAAGVTERLFDTGVPMLAGATARFVL